MSARLQLRDIFNQDLDKLFSYRTPMLVLIKDKTLGLLAILINICILIYFIVYVIVMQKAYLAEEYSRGSAVLYTTGTAISLDGNRVRVWDAVDVTYPVFDPSAIVITTQVTETIKQQKGTCKDLSRPCSSDQECIIDGRCNKGYCEEPSWCSQAEIKTFDLVGVENFIIWIQGSIDFITKGIKMTTLGENKAKVYPGSGSNSYLLGDIMKIGNINFEEVKKTGAVVKITLHWNCDVTWHNDCDPEVKVKRIDDLSGQAMGFRYDRYLYYKDEGVQYRDYLNVTGIKLIVESSGRAYALTLQSIILNVSSAINLTMLTPRIVDFLMIWVLKDRKLYRELKYVVTKDLNEESTNIVQPDESEGRIEPRSEKASEDYQDSEPPENLP